MKHGIFAVKDLAAQCFQTPFTAPHSGVAIRSFQDAVNSEQVDQNGRRSDLANHPSDFELYQIAEFVPDTGQVLGSVADDVSFPLLLVRAKDVVNQSSLPV